jgi:hypothetical protein
MREDTIYVELVYMLLRAKREGTEPAAIARALVRAASEAGVRRHEINEAYEELGI